MPRTPLASLVQNLFSTARESQIKDLPVEAIVERRTERALTRRHFLSSSVRIGGTALGALALEGTAFAASASRSARIAIVGGGLAGLTCAYRLRQAGYTATIYEAASRIGGRCYTRRGYFADGQIVERGGELIDTDHTAILGLAQELGLTVDDLLAAEPAGTVPVYRFGGTPYTYAQATADFQAIFPQLQNDLNAAGYPTTWDGATHAGRAFDGMSIAKYIDRLVPGGRTSPFGKLLDVAYNIEFGAETSQQSALSLLYLLGYSDPNVFQVFGASDERFHIRGGNDQVATRLASILGDQIEYSQALVDIRLKSDGRYLLTFVDGEGDSETQTADHVVLALPFSILRHSVGYTKAGFDNLKKIAIQNLGMGTNTKFHLQFTDRLWNQSGNNGDTYSDTGYQNTWEVSRGQAGRSGILVNFTGGTIGAGFDQGSVAAHAATFLDQIEPVLPGITNKFNGRATVDYWTGYTWTLGSYSYWKVGQYTQFAGYEQVRQGNVHFCGEHTSLDSQGYLNGAVATGEDAAAEIVADLS